MTEASYVGRTVVWRGETAFLPAAAGHEHAVVTETTAVAPGVEEVGRGVAVHAGDTGMVTEQFALQPDGTAVCRVRFGPGVLTTPVPQPLLALTEAPAVAVTALAAPVRRRYAEQRPPSPSARLWQVLRQVFRPAGRNA